MVYLDPLPPEIADTYYDQLGRPYYLSPEKLEGDYATVRFERELGILRRFCPAGELLDVGCSTGGFLHQLQSRLPGHYQSLGIEVSRPALEFARRRGLEVIHGSLLSHDFGSRRFDAITFWAVLEHLADPAAFAGRAAGLLKPGGLCLALVPNLDALAVRILGARYRYILSQHVNYFSSRTLRQLFTTVGLHVVASGGSHFNPIVLWQDVWRGSDAPVPDARRAGLLQRTTRLKQSAWLRPAKALLDRFEMLLAAANLADNIWIVACKQPRAHP
jgi:2-polyprenyl-3-methyl-5-hydroxy-6-metoxy-1,4-benzoquinol methylase